MNFFKKAMLMTATAGAMFASTQKADAQTEYDITAGRNGWSAGPQGITQLASEGVVSSRREGPLPKGKYGFDSLRYHERDNMWQMSFSYQPGLRLARVSYDVYQENENFDTRVNAYDTDPLVAKHLKLYRPRYVKDGRYVENDPNARLVDEVIMVEYYDDYPDQYIVSHAHADPETHQQIHVPLISRFGDNMEFVIHDKKAEKIVDRYVSRAASFIGSAQEIQEVMRDIGNKIEELSATPTPNPSRAKGAAPKR